MKNLTLNEVSLYNTLLALNWSNSSIKLSDVMAMTGQPSGELKATLDTLAAKGKALVGPEDIDGVIVHTITPVIKGGNAYGFPEDFFKDYAHWMFNAIELPAYTS